MAQSLRIGFRNISKTKSLLLRNQISSTVSRNLSNSCFLCGTLRHHTLVSAANLKYLKPLQPITSTAFNKFSTAADPPSNPDKNEKIYHGGLTSQVRRIKYFTLGTSFMGISVQPIIWTKFIEKYGAGITYSVLSFVGFFTLITPFLIHYVTKKYVTELYYNPESQTYTAVTFNFFNGRIETKFKQKDVYRPDMLGMFETFRVKGKPLFVDASQFRHPEDYVKLMGYDKPIDFTYYDDKITTTKSLRENK